MTHHKIQSENTAVAGMKEGFEEFEISYTESEKQETLERLASVLRNEGV